MINIPIPLVIHLGHEHDNLALDEIPKGRLCVWVGSEYQDDDDPSMGVLFEDFK